MACSSFHTTNKACGALNEYVTISNESVVKYDEDGNLTQDGTWTYTYDGENRVKTMTAGTTTISFLYDWLGRRISKTRNRKGSCFTFHLDDMERFR